MRRKFAKQIRHQILHLKKEILSEGWITEPGWKRKDVGYEVQVLHNGWTYLCSGRDELEAYKIALECVIEDADIAPPSIKV